MATLKGINEKFSPEEFSALLKYKGSKSWHDFIMEKCVPKQMKKDDPFNIDMDLDKETTLW